MNHGRTTVAGFSVHIDIFDALAAPECLDNSCSVLHIGGWARPNALRRNMRIEGSLL